MKTPSLESRPRSRGFRKHTSPAKRLALVVGSMLLCGCRVLVFSGPSTVSVGETVTYVLEVANNNASINDITLHLVADVPEGWELLAGWYEGTLQGMPVAGTGTEIGSEICDFRLGDLRPGFRRVHLAAGPFPGVSSSDTGTVTLEFAVGGQPAGEFDIFFVIGGEGPFGGCSVPAGRTINRSQPAFLRWVDVLFESDEGVEGLGGAGSVTVSPDGRHAYVTGDSSDAVTAFSRDLFTGRLAFVEALFDGGGGGEELEEPSAVVASPDGRHLYVACAMDQAINVFARDAVSGRLTFVDFVEVSIRSGESRALALSPDGRHLYVMTPGGAAIRTYSRDDVTGALELVGDLFAGVGRPTAVTVSADGLHLYAVSRNHHTLMVFARDGVSGEVALVEEHSGIPDLVEPSDVAVSPDGAHVYVSSRSFSAGALLVFARDAVTGQLSFVEAVLDERPGVSGLERTSSVAVSREGSHVLTAGGQAVSVFRRDALSGQLQFVEAHFDGLAELASLVISPDNQFLYLVSDVDHAVTTHEMLTRIFFDGFESGDTSAWSP